MNLVNVELGMVNMMLLVSVERYKLKVVTIRNHIFMV